MSSNIDVITVCYNSSHFIDNLLSSLKETTKNNFRLVVVDNGSSQEHQDKLDLMSNSNEMLILRRKQANVNPTYAASRNHGEAIQHAVVNLPKDNIGIVMDCDSFMIKKHWDNQIIPLLDYNKHVSCKRPGVKFGCGAWFSAFRIRDVIENEVSFLPIIKPNGFDCPRPNLYDVGSDMDRIKPWYPLHAHPVIKYHYHGHVWMLDGDFILDHMGGSRNSGDFNHWVQWSKDHWRKNR
jgi:glycosyltransferase involved in cell wall biosynthesis